MEILQLRVPGNVHISQGAVLYAEVLQPGSGLESQRRYIAVPYTDADQVLQQGKSPAVHAFIDVLISQRLALDYILVGDVSQRRMGKHHRGCRIYVKLVGHVPVKLPYLLYKEYRKLLGAGKMEIHFRLADASRILGKTYHESLRAFQSGSDRKLDPLFLPPVIVMDLCRPGNIGLDGDGHLSGRIDRVDLRLRKGYRRLLLLACTYQKEEHRDCS